MYSSRSYVAFIHYSSNWPAQPARPLEFLESSLKLWKHEGVFQLVCSCAAKTAYSAAQTADSGVQTADSGVQTADSGVQTADSGVQSVDSVSQTPDSCVQSVDSVSQTPDSCGQTANITEQTVEVFSAFSALFTVLQAGS